jgi:hypothetical protein
VSSLVLVREAGGFEDVRDSLDKMVQKKFARPKDKIQWLCQPRKVIGQNGTDLFAVFVEILRGKGFKSG